MQLRTLRPVLLATLVVALGAGCVDPFEEGSSSVIDKDDDGYSEELDCDDEDSEVHPGATEKENCFDDNCDGKVDEDTPNADLDGDTYCPSTGDLTEHGCEGNAQRNPGMAEDGGDGSSKPNGVDDNCNGQVDEGLPESDMDQDGFTVKDGDCNDGDPFINPGAIEVAGFECDKPADCPDDKCYDGFCRCLADEDCSSLTACIDDSQCEEPGEKCDGKVCKGIWRCLDGTEGMPQPELKVCRDNTDNDCDGQADELGEACDDPASLDPTDPFDYAKAMDLCDTDHVCGLEKGCPGELACVDGRCRRVLLASFNAAADPRSRSIGATLGKATSELIAPRRNKSFAIFASGLASYDPKTICPQQGTDFGNTGVDPDPQAFDKEALDTSELKLEILVPTNARSFSFDFHFLTTEYPEFLDTEFNDTFWVQLISKKFKGNISFDKNGTPIRLNNAFFDICDPDPMHPKTTQFCTRPAIDLTGTGYYTECAGNLPAGGSTGWLTTVAPVEPGEKITLIFTIFDKGDHILDSAVLIDNFRWKLTPALKPVTGPK